MRMLRTRALVFASLGVLLAAGAPSGLLLARLLAGRTGLERLGEEWSANRLTYIYVGLSTATAFACFGAALGRYADRLARFATRDALTGLLNRAGLLERLEGERLRRRRRADPLALLLVDVDRLKQVNDSRGHRAGDDVLCRVASGIARACRGGDACGRWGGDEFLVVAPSTSADGAWALATRIRESVADSGPDAGPSVSIGVAVADALPATASVDRLLQAADRALYAAKRAGGDRVRAESA